MATVYATNATARDVTVPPTKIDVTDQGGRIRVAWDQYVASGVIANATVIRFMKLPQGARVVGYWIKSDDLGTTGTGKLGYEANGSDVADDDAFFASLDFNAAAATIGHQDQENMPGLGFKFAKETQISLTMTAATTAAGNISVCMFYVVD